MTSNRQTSGRSVQLGGLSIPGADDLLASVLPANVYDAQTSLAELRIDENRAMGAVHTTQVAIADAEKADSDAYAASIRAREPDPGPANADKARAAHADAQRKATGMAEAVHLAEVDLDAALRSADLVPTVLELETRAHAAIDRVRALMAECLTARNEALAARSLAMWLDAFPQGSIGVHHDGAAFGWSLDRMTADLEQILTPVPWCLRPPEPEPEPAPPPWKFKKERIVAF